MASKRWRIAVIGAGPAGMFAAEALSQREDVDVIVLEKLFAPDGLLRYGVAPDHPSIKRLSKSFDRTRARPNVHFVGGVEVGSAAQLDALHACFHRIVLATGASSDRRLGISGEDAQGVVSAREFVEWYNGHPDADPDAFRLDCEEVVVVGAGNVALDVARILLRPVEDLEPTDIATYALDVLRTSKVRRVHLLVRRGPADISFTLPECRDLANMDGVRMVVAPDDFQLTAEDRGRIGLDRGLGRIVEILESRMDVDDRPDDPRRVLRFHFFTSPSHVLVEDGKMVGLRCVRNERVKGPDGRTTMIANPEASVDLPATLLLRSIGYRVLPVDGLPYDQERQVVRSEERTGRVVDASGNAVGKIWVTGWARRGPTGVVGTNKADAQDVAADVLASLDGATPSDLQDWRNDLEAFIDTSAWLALDAEELRRGEARGRSREKFTRFEDVFDFLASL